MRLLGLADILREADLEVIELDGWQSRGGPLSRVDAIVCHGTITPATAKDANVARILRDGRADLPGPLSQLGLDRQGGWWVIASGRCSHNGYGTHGNNTVGIEAFHDGKEQWQGTQLRSWERGCAALCRHLGVPVGRVLGHKETDPNRKVDPGGLSMDTFRKNVSKLLAEEDDVTPEQAEWLGRVHHELTNTESIHNRQLREIRDMLNLITKGAEGFGIPPVPTTVARIAKKLGA